MPRYHVTGSVPNSTYDGLIDYGSGEHWPGCSIVGSDECNCAARYGDYYHPEDDMEDPPRISDRRPVDVIVEAPDPVEAIAVAGFDRLNLAGLVAREIVPDIQAAALAHEAMGPDHNVRSILGDGSLLDWCTCGAHWEAAGSEEASHA